MNTMSGIYIHIPFCHKACHYCDFHFSTQLGYIDRMIASITKELTIRKDELNQVVETIYFGGGTPSLLNSDQLSGLMAHLYSNFELSPETEVTLEANPEDLTLEKAREFASLGINRLSVGIQTFDNDQLKFLNRAHNSRQALESIENARAAGIENITLDLIFALPGHGTTKFEKDVKTALKLEVPHMSIYGLTIEEGTAFGNWVRRGKLKEETEMENTKQYKLAERLLMARGYEHYEVSNYCLPGYQSRHNTSYWLQKAYLGLGPGAHSYDGSHRIINQPNNHVYMKALEQDGSYQEVEKLRPIDQINEYILTRLRTVFGADLDFLKGEYGADLFAEKREFLEQLQEKGLASLNQGVLSLSRHGFLIADEISLELFYEK